MLRSYGGGRLFGEAFGGPEPRVLALHGWARTHRDFDGVLAGAAGAGPLDAVALDLPGFGDSPPPDRPWGSPDYADAVGAAVEEMRPPVVVLGHSFGGRVAVHLAARRPDLVAGLVLTGVPLWRSTGPAPRPAPAFRLARRLRRLGLISEGRMEAARRRYGSADYRAARGIMREVLVTLLQERYEDTIAAVSCPVTLVWGDDDTAAPLALARAGADAWPLAELTVCPGAGHLTPLTVPDVLRRAVLQRLG